MKGLLTLAILLLLVLTAAARSQSSKDRDIQDKEQALHGWSLIDHALDDSLSMYCRLKSITGDESPAYRRAWIKVIYPRSQEIAGLTIREYQSLYECDCTQSRWRRLSSVKYDAQGNSVNSDDEPEAWSFPPPDSMGKSALIFICRAAI